MCAEENESIEKLLANNELWVEKHTNQNPLFFKEMAAKDQKPEYLWIGCSDSRVPAEEIVQLLPGDLFVHRNIANLYVYTDLNAVSVLEFAVKYLKIKHVIVCGHTQCGGVQAAMSDQQHGIVDKWLRNIRDVYAQNREVLDAITDEKKRLNHLVELNVMQQVKNISYTSIVQNRWLAGEALDIHGFVYDLKTGKLKDLGYTVSQIEQVDPIYRQK